MQSPVYFYIRCIWVAVGLVWLAGAFAAKRSARRQSARSRLWHLLFTTLAFLLLFSDRLRIGPLAWRFVPDSPAILWIALALTFAGCAFAVWARLLLGSNWSAMVTIKQDHSLVRRGPYAIVRHPIYSGALLGLFGTALALGELRGLLAVALASFSWHIKSRLEETFMIQQFGAEYIRYRNEVAALIPFLL